MENICTVLPTVKKVGKALVTYAIIKRGASYGLAISSTARTEGSVFIADIAENLETAENIKRTFAENLLSPLHAFDVLDDVCAEFCF